MPPLRGNICPAHRGSRYPTILQAPSLLGDSEISAVMHTPFKMIPHFNKRGRRWFQASCPRHCDSSPGTFSRRKNAGRLAARSRATSKNRVPLVSSNPSRFPATEKLWQGNPAQSRSKSGISSGLLISCIVTVIFSFRVIDGAVRHVCAFVDLTVTNAFKPADSLQA